MNYTSTRDSGVSVSGAQAVVRGISPDGGLYLPTELPRLPQGFFADFARLDYPARAESVLALFFPELAGEKLHAVCQGAYLGAFEEDIPAPIAAVGGDRYFIELWHGPTCAFKDIALQLLPRLMPLCARETGFDKELVVLTATSGDTGKAALEGFRDVPGTRIAVFYPSEGVSDMQKRQMTTQLGGNVAVCGINGNFDDAQSAVKEIFTDPRLAAQLADRGFAFSSANSINWGRLAPQIVYYLSAYADLLSAGEIADGERVNICVPTGNFGNILAACYAAEMGLPVGRFICASNSNNVLTDFIRTGVYDRNREFFTTASPSMDILISSNLERLLFTLEGGNSSRVRDMMAELKASGRFEISAGAKERLQGRFWGGWCGEDATSAAIARVFGECSYLCDPHTAVAVDVLDQYRAATGDSAKALIAATASPFKFAPSVLPAIGESVPADSFAALEKLSEASGMEIPAPLAALKELPARFSGVCEADGLRGFIKCFLGM